MMVMIADSDDGDDDGNDNGDEDEERTPTFHEVERFSGEKRDTAICDKEDKTESQMHPNAKMG